MTIGAYILHVGENGKFYIGSSENVEKRFQRHIRDLTRFEHHNELVMNEWCESGLLNLEILKTDNLDQARKLEQSLIDKNLENDKLMNIGKSVSGGDNLSRNPRRREIIRKMTETNVKRYSEMMPELLQQYASFGEKNGMYGKTHTPEARAKIAAANRRRPKKEFYAPMSEEAKKKISDFAKTRTGSLNAFYGRQHSVETKKNMSEKAKARKLKPTNSRKVQANGVVYESVTEASRQLNISPMLVIHRIKSKLEKYNSYSYIPNA